jgi:hypothetical protein
MIKQASSVRKHLRRLLAADPGRDAGGSAVNDPLGPLAVGGNAWVCRGRRSMTGVLRRPQPRTKAPSQAPQRTRPASRNAILIAASTPRLVAPRP